MFAKIQNQTLLREHFSGCGLVFRPGCYANRRILFVLIFERSPSRILVQGSCFRSKALYIYLAQPWLWFGLRLWVSQLGCGLVNSVVGWFPDLGCGLVSRPSHRLCRPKVSMIVVRLVRWVGSGDPPTTRETAHNHDKFITIRSSDHPPLRDPPTLGALVSSQL